jgi:protein-tyrosine phosphatase
MKDFYWIIPGLLAGRPGPRLIPWDLEALWEEGFRTIVSLIRADRMAIRSAGFRHYHAPMYSGLSLLPFLRRWMAHKILPVVDFIAAELAESRPTLVHCYLGKDRTGAVLTGYLMRYCGLTAMEAVRRLQQANPRVMTGPGYRWMPEILDRIGIACRNQIAGGNLSPDEQPGADEEWSSR